MKSHTLCGSKTLLEAEITKALDGVGLFFTRDVHEWRECEGPRLRVLERWGMPFEGCEEIEM